MKSKLIQVLLWALAKLGYQIPVVKPVIIDFKSLQRVRTQEVISYNLLAQTRPGIKTMIEHRVKETFASKVAELAEVREEPTPDGLKYSCDMLACNFPYGGVINNDINQKTINNGK